MKLHHFHIRVTCQSLEIWMSTSICILFACFFIQISPTLFKFSSAISFNVRRHFASSFFMLWQRVTRASHIRQGQMRGRIFDAHSFGNRKFRPRLPRGVHQKGWNKAALRS